MKMKKICIKCSSELPEGSAFCPSCGAPVPVNNTQNNFCRNCGTKLSEGTAFCHKCGTPVVGGQTPTPVMGGQNPTVEKNFENGHLMGSPEASPYNAGAQQPMFSDMQMNSTPVYSQSGNSIPPRAVRRAKKAKDRTIIAAAAVIAVIVIVLAVKGIAGLFKNKGVDGDFDDLCEMTSLGTQSYVYARMLTEQLLETDLATADPQYVSDLLKECEAAWKST